MTTRSIQSTRYLERLASETEQSARSLLIERSLVPSMIGPEALSKSSFSSCTFRRYAELSLASFLRRIGKET